MKHTKGPLSVAQPVVAEEWAFPTFEDWLASPIERPSSPHGLHIQYAKLAFNAGRAAHPVAGSPAEKFNAETCDQIRAVQLVAAMQAEAAAPEPSSESDLERDAARYRWMRSLDNLKASELVNRLWDDKLDAAIDAEMSANAAGQSLCDPAHPSAGTQ